MTIKLHLTAGVSISLAEGNIKKYSTSYGGAVVQYEDAGEDKTIGVYEPPRRIQHSLEVNHEQL